MAMLVLRGGCGRQPLLRTILGERLRLPDLPPLGAAFPSLRTPGLSSSSTPQVLRPIEVLSAPRLPGLSMEVAAAAAVVGQRSISETVASAAAAVAAAGEIFSGWADFLRPRRFSMRLDVKMKRAAAPYPRNPNRKKPVPKVKGIIRKLLD
eukprot:TRINITY_DN113817_c0_g1_i1.p1 TRINITY_DN113817_c0_g1~~TRINITY_DN113817_c0_g1_i1.p1  ORF type:complete len:171 (+),score=32.63 TRINITY_DN113817_c0_g1_i1:62-514(+)